MSSLIRCLWKVLHAHLVKGPLMSLPKYLDHSTTIQGIYCWFLVNSPKALSIFVNLPKQSGTYQSAQDMLGPLPSGNLPFRLYGSLTLINDSRDSGPFYLVSGDSIIFVACSWNSRFISVWVRSYKCDDIYLMATGNCLIFRRKGSILVLTKEL